MLNFQQVADEVKALKERVSKLEANSGQDKSDTVLDMPSKRDQAVAHVKSKGYSQATAEEIVDKETPEVILQSVPDEDLDKVNL